MEHSPITNAAIDDWEHRALGHALSTKSDITNMAEALRYHLKGIAQLQADGMLDESEVALLRAANATLKDQIKERDRVIGEMRAILNG